MSRMHHLAALAMIAGGLALATSNAGASPAALVAATPALEGAAALLTPVHAHSVHVVPLHHRYRYRPYLYVAPPVYVGPGDCGWLRARWRATGSRYWYRRWRACIG
jgi:hypothetical protein